MPELLGMEQLRNKLAIKRTRVLLRYKYYDMKFQAPDLGISTPPKMTSWRSVLGWCAKAVDSMADRLQFREFRNDNFRLNDIFQTNNRDILFDSAVKSALISSCCFIYISPGEDGYPRLQVIDGSNATGVIDPLTNMLLEGYAVLDRDRYGEPITEAYFEPYKTTYYRKAEEPEVYENSVPYPLLVPIINRPDAERPFGHSKISRACMDLVENAMRTVKRSEISAEFYSFPQKYVTGLAEDAEFDSWKASMSSMIAFTRDENDNEPHVGQFAQQSMIPHMDHLKLYASLFAGETGLTLDDLGFPTESPTSSETIRAQHESLRREAKKAQRTFGAGFLNTGFVAACLRDEFPYQRKQIYLTKPIWEPVFDVDMAGLSLIGDALIKIQQAMPDYLGKNSMRDLTGIVPEDDI